MRGQSNIVGGIHSIKQAHDHFQLFEFEHPNTKGAALFNSYRKKLHWIYRDLISNPALTQEVREGIKQEWESDCFDVPAITEKVELLNPKQRELIESIVDAMIRGEEINVFDTPNPEKI